MASRINSIANVENEAKQLSITHQNIVYYVITKKNKGALCYSVDWLAMNKIVNQGYRPVCTYFNGKRY